MGTRNAEFGGAVTSDGGVAQSVEGRGGDRKCAEKRRPAGSQRAAALLSNWAGSVSKFRQIVPVTIAQPAATPEPAAEQENVTRPVV